MNLKEAKQKMLQGIKMTHPTFSDYEYIFYDTDAILKDEFGNHLNWADFWKYRQHVNFQTGWCLYTKN